MIHVQKKSDLFFFDALKTSPVPAEAIFTIIKNTRGKFVQLLDGLSAEELNTVPDGFANNIAWNFGHIVVTTPLLCYGRTGARPDATVRHSDFYKNGTRPGRPLSEAEIGELKALSVSTIEQLEREHAEGLFGRIEPCTTATFGGEIRTIEEMLATTLAHDMLHYGYAMAQKRIICG